MPGRNDLDIKHFRFRGLHPGVCMGTASDRYAGWIGQVYSKEPYEGRIAKRTHRVGGKRFQERVLPVECVVEYFQHFRVLEIDYTFYRPLLDEKGDATQTFHVLRSYKEQLRSGDHLLLKVPQMIFAQRLRGSGGSFLENPQYLNVDAFMKQFYQPAVDLLGANLKGFVFEQEYQRRDARTPLRNLVRDLEAFFTALPKDNRYHMELRTESYLDPAMFEVMEKHGVGQILSHWTWLPSLAKQFAKSGRRFFNAGRQCVLRLMTPIGTRYEAAYVQAHPFDKLVVGMVQQGMIDDAAGLMHKGIEDGVEVNLIINNRAGGNAPQIAQLIATRFMAVNPGNKGSENR